MENNKLRGWRTFVVIILALLIFGFLVFSRPAIDISNLGLSIAMLLGTYFGASGFKAKQHAKYTGKNDEQPK